MRVTISISVTQDISHGTSIFGRNRKYWAETISSFGNNVAFSQEGKFSFTNTFNSTNRLVSLHFQIYLMTIFDRSITSGEGYSLKKYSLWSTGRLSRFKPLQEVWKNCGVSESYQTGADPGFARGGANPRGCQAIIRPNFPENYMNI